MEEDLFENFPVISETDKAILMHRDIHFGGKFDFMIDYYLKGGKGIHPDFELTRIKELQIIEEGMKQNLAGLMLSGPDAERVAEAKDAYKKLKDLYEKESDAYRLPKIIADLILSEEENPQAEIDAVVAEKGAMVPLLMDLLKSEDFHDSLFPGYGYAPALATKCLGLIGDKRAIISLFESIGNEDFFNEDLALEALHKIGEPAKAFLLKVMHARPITADNESAALALVQFKDDPEVGKACLEALKGLDIKKEFPLATYLILACEGITDKKQQQELIALGKLPSTPGMLRRDIETLSKSW
jgi:hypothetical protein